MKYIVCNLKNHLNEFNINDYINTIQKITYKNVIFCIDKKYINLFKNYKLCTQNYYDDLKKEYVLIGHYEKKESKEEIKEKITKALNQKIKVILCIGNENIKDYKSIKKQISYYLDKESNNIIIAYEPYNMIGSKENINIDDLTNIVKNIKKDFNDIKVLYGGNVNEKNINEIIEITDGVLIARLSYNPHKLTNILNKIKKSI
ncbi:MAG: triose-phosphate isomerase [Bacilli bacterium]|nr:triose-phosphate isomerase [Bacilli bacterium]